MADILKSTTFYLAIIIVLSIVVSLYLRFTSSDVPQPIIIEFSFGAEDNILYQEMENSLNKAVEILGIDAKINYTYAFTNILLQEQNILDGINRKPDVFVIMPQDSERIVRSIKEVQNAGIPVIMYNRPSDPQSMIQPTAYVGLDTYNQAYTTAVALFKLMREDAVEPRVFNLMGHLSDRNAVMRKAGLYAAAKEMDVHIIKDIETYWDNATAETNLNQAFTEHPEGNALFCSSDWLIPGVEKALRTQERWTPYGHPRHLYLGSQDVYPIGLDYLKAGFIDVNTAFDLSPMSMMLLRIIVLVLNDHELSQMSYLIPGRIITKKNLNTITELWSESNTSSF